MILSARGFQSVVVERNKETGNMRSVGGGDMGVFRCEVTAQRLTAHWRDLRTRRLGLPGSSRKVLLRY